MPDLKRLVAATTIACSVLMVLPTHSSASEAWDDVVPGYWKFVISERAYSKGPAASRERKSLHKSISLPVCFAADKTWYSPDSSKQGSWDSMNQDVMMHGNYIADGYEGGGNVTAKLTLANRRLMKGTWGTWSDSQKRPFRSKIVVAKKSANTCDRVFPFPETSDQVTPGVYDKDVRDLPGVKPWQPGDPVREVPKGARPKSQQK